MLVVPRKLLFVDRSHSGTSNWHPQLMAFFQSLHQPSTCAILVVANLSNEKWSIWSVQSAYNHWILNLFQQTCVWTFKTSYNSSPSDWSIIIHSLLGPEDSGTPCKLQTNQTMYKHNMQTSQTLFGVALDEWWSIKEICKTIIIQETEQ